MHTEKLLNIRQPMLLGTHLFKINLGSAQLINKDNLSPLWALAKRQPITLKYIWLKYGIMCIL